MTVSIYVVNSTLLVGVVTIPASIPLGGYIGYLSTPNGTVTGGITFTVISAPIVTLTSITPNTGSPDSTIDVTLVGTNFTPDMYFVVTCGNIVVSNVSFVNSSTATARFSIGSNQTGACAVYVYTSQGNSNAQTFTVAYGSPTVETIGPRGITGLPGQYTFTLKGTNFVPDRGTVVYFCPDLVLGTVSRVSVGLAYILNFTFTLNAPVLTVTACNVSVTTPYGTSNAVVVTINPPPRPMLTSITPSGGIRGATLNISLTGTNLAPLAGERTLLIVNGDITVGMVNVISSTELRTTFVLSPTAAVGAYGVTVTTLGGVSNTVSFRIGPNLQNFLLIQPVVSAGQPTIGTLTISSAAPPEGATVNLSSSDVHAAVPATVTVPAGSTTATFFVTTTSFPGGISNPLTVTITATLGSSVQGTLTVLPPGTPVTTNIEPFNIASLGAVSVITASTAVTPTMGYSVIEPTGSTTPSGVAIFGVRQNNVLVSETGVPASLPMTSGRIYAEVAGAVNTGIAIANPYSSPATINFVLTSETGTDLGSGNTTIPPNSQLAKFINEPPYNSGAPFQGTFSFTSTVSVAVVALRAVTNERGEFLISTLPVIDTTVAPNSGIQVLPEYSDGAGWTTEILLVNPTGTPLSGSVQFTNSEGTPSNVRIADETNSSFVYSIAARSSQKLATSGTAATVTTGSIRVVPAGDTAPTALAVFSSKRDGVTVSLAGVSVTTGTVLRMYVESSGISGQSGNIQSGVAIANNSSSSATVAFELTQFNGTTPFGAVPVSITLPSAGQTARFVSDIFPNLPNPFKGVLRISTTSSTISVVGLRTRYNERSDFLITTTPAVAESSPPAATQSTPPVRTEPAFPVLIDGGGFTTQFILFNGTAGTSASGSLRFFDTKGQPLSLTLQ